MKIPRFNPPFKGFHVVSKVVMLLVTWNWASAITLFPFVFYKNQYGRMNLVTRNHETIHIHQFMECLFVAIILYVILGLVISVWTWTLLALLLFYWIYLLNWVVNLFRYGRKAYNAIAFEREAYFKANINNYHLLRRPFDWVKHL